MKKPQVELLAPASGLEAIRSAIYAGADAVYTGGNRFGARAYAANLNEQELLWAIDFVHLQGKRLYLTVNTLLKEKELAKELISYLRPYYIQGLDAVIVQDIGVFCTIKEHFPDLPIHVSTQAVVTGKNSSQCYEKMGAKRIVTARELSLEELKEIRKTTNLEIESFIHGALCYCYSGQCLFSSFAGGRSGNRGRCAQPCRLPYGLYDEKGTLLSKSEEEYLLSPKDICTLDLLPDLIEAGIYSLKIEGRMKRTEYTAGVTEIYRSYIDQYLANGSAQYRVNPKDREQLLDLYNRGGFHTGYYQMHNGTDMMDLSRPNHNGVYAGTLTKEKKGYQMNPVITLQKQDVLELRGVKYKDQNLELVLEQDISPKESYYLPKQYSGLLRGRDFVEVYRTKNEQLLQNLHKKYIEGRKQISIQGEVIAEENQPIQLILHKDKQTISVLGETIQTAKNQPLEPEIIRKQIEKTGNTPFVFEALEVTVIGNGFLTAKALNQLRRDGLQALEESMVKAFRRELPNILELEDRGVSISKQEPNPSMPKCHVWIENLECLELLLQDSSVDAIAISIHAFPLFKEPAEQGMRQLKRAYQSCKAANISLYLVFPHIWRLPMERMLPAMASLLENIDGIVAKNLEVLTFVKTYQEKAGTKVPVMLDYTAYAMNQKAVQIWKKLGASSVTVPLELNKGEIQAFTKECQLPMELILYGHMPMMVSAQCPIKNTTGCQKKPRLTRLKDRKGNWHYVKNYCDLCYSVIYNDAALYLIDLVNEVRNLPIDAVRLQFSIETKEEVQEIMNQYKAAFELGTLSESKCPQGYTRGHWKRGVE